MVSNEIIILYSFDIKVNNQPLQVNNKKYLRWLQPLLECLIHYGCFSGSFTCLKYLLFNPRDLIITRGARILFQARISYMTTSVMKDPSPFLHPYYLSIFPVSFFLSSLSLITYVIMHMTTAGHISIGTKMLRK